jgi:hypothetical protein
MDAVREVRRDARRGAHSAWIGYLGRAGLAAQGVCFWIIGAFAVELALGAGGTATNPQGALDALARHGWTRVLLFLLCIGFAGYALWRLSQALFDRGNMGSDPAGLGRRTIQLVQGLTYVALTVGAARTLAGAPAKSGNERRAASGMLGWPGGRELVAAIGVVLLVSAVVTVYWALSRRFEESLATEQMRDGTRRFAVATGIAGLCSLGVVLAIVGWFLVKAAVEFQPKAPVGIGGALAKLAHASYGDWLLGITATGLVVFAVFDLLQARFHKA